MSERIQLPIAMWRLQYNLLGGHHRMIGGTGIYALALLAGAYGCRRLLSDDPLADVAGILLNVLAGIQIFIAVLVGCNAVHRASLRDFESKMIESHRLTPMTSGTVVLGYLFGTTLQIQAFFFVGLIIGMVLTTLAKIPINSWVLGNLLIFNGAVTLWSAVLLSGLRQAKPISPAGFLIAAAVLGNLGILLLPAAGLLLSAYPVMFGFGMATGGGWPVRSAILMITAVNVVMTVFWLSAAAAKYRRPDLPALNGVRGLILLAFWTVFGTIGLVIYSSFTVGGGGVGPTGTDTLMMQWTATIILSFLVALPAIAGSVECGALFRRGTAARRWSDRVSPFLICWLATLVVFVPLATIGWSLESDILYRQLNVENPTVTTTLVWPFTLVACFLAFLTAVGAHEVFFGRVKNPRAAAMTILLAFWAMPPIGDMLWVSWITSKDAYADIEATWLMGCSPAGTIAEVWGSSSSVDWAGTTAKMLLVGLAFQIVLAVSLGLVGRFGRRKQSIPASTHPTSLQQSNDVQPPTNS